jgi:hypothetical protein
MEIALDDIDVEDLEADVTCKGQGKFSEWECGMGKAGW